MKNVGLKMVKSRAGVRGKDRVVVRERVVVKDRVADRDRVAARDKVGARVKAKAGAGNISSFSIHCRIGSPLWTVFSHNIR